MERYKRLSVNEYLYLAKCPLLIEKYALTMDNKSNSVLCQIKFKNLGDKNIKAVFVKIFGFDVSGEKVGNYTEYIYNDLSVGKSAYFGGDVGVELENVNIRSIKIHCSKIIFFDGTSESFEEDTFFEKLPDRKSLINRVDSTLLVEFSKLYREKLKLYDGMFIPDNNDTVRLCYCGEYTLTENKVCPKCGKTEEWWQENTSVEKLKEFKAQREERERIEAEKAEARRIEEEKQSEARRIEEEKVQAKREKKLKILSWSLAVVIIGTIIGYAVVTNFVIPMSKYNEAEELLANKDCYGAIKIFEELGDFNDSKAKIDDIMKSISDKANFAKNSISAGNYYTVCLKKDGTVVATGLEGNEQCNVSGWKDIVQVSSGNSHTLGLKSDGTVLAVGNMDYGKCEVSKWNDIVDISAGFNHSVGLKQDGTVVATGLNRDGQCDVDGWKDIIAVSAGNFYTLGLKQDGTVVATGYNYGGQCNVSSWKDIVAVSAGGSHTVGLKKDGTVVATGLNRIGQCDVSNWKDIVAVSAGGAHTIGLKQDGTVIATGSNYNGQCDILNWKDIVAVSAGRSHTVGLKADGTVVAIGSIYYGQCDISDWKDIKVYKN